MLQARGDQIVDAAGRPVRLRGVCVGGWMNLEHFINGYPGTEQGIRAAMEEALGVDAGRKFFERLLDAMLAEDDIAFLKSCGVTVIRLPLNYRHFEDDAKPFAYREEGFARLNRVLEWCARHGVYAILDLHAVQGWQSPDWHCDNASRHALLWQHPHFQDRLVALWEEFARRYKGHATIAAYNIMNEPVSGGARGRYGDSYTPNWATLNHVYRRVVTAIRAIDPDHLIALEGDLFSTKFDGLDAPFAPNLIYSSHNYTPAGFGQGHYPGAFGAEDWDRAKQRDVFLAHEGTRFAQQHRVPLWVGEFGSVYNGPSDEVNDRLRAVHDEIDVFEEFRAHWTMWTYKDIGVMGWVQVDPESDYMQRITPINQARRQLSTESWMYWLPVTPAKELIMNLAQLLMRAIPGYRVDPKSNGTYLRQAVLDCYVGNLIQPAYAQRFAGLSDDELGATLASFRLDRCRRHDGLLAVVKQHLARPV